MMRGMAMWVLIAGLALGYTTAAQTMAAQTTRPGVRHGALLVREVLTVTGTLRLVPQPAGEGSALEIDAGALGRFRINEIGLGAELKSHADEQVSVVGFVEPFEQDGQPVLRVANFTLHDRRA